MNSRGERNYLHRKLKGRPTYWIGFRDISGSNTGFQWVDGSGGYTNWHSGQPDSNNGAQMCARVYTNHGTWDNVQCHTRIRFLCKQVSLCSNSNRDLYFGDIRFIFHYLLTVPEDITGDIQLCSTIIRQDVMLGLS